MTHQRDTDRAALLEVEDLRTWFPTARGTLHAVDGVSLSLRPGESMGIVGESGSGKSVLGRSVMGLLPSTAQHPAGRVTFDGADVGALSKRARRALWGSEIAMIFQDPMTSLNPVVRIGRQITEAMDRHLDLSKSETRSRALELLEQVGITEPGRHLRSYPHQLSGGMRQRVAIAIALSCHPRLLIADEPTTALDVTVQRQILDLLGGLQRSLDMAMILITHDLGVVAGRTQRLAVMYGGKIVESGPTATVFRQPRHPYTRALPDAVPRIDGEPHQRLRAIAGRPTNIIAPGPGCRFANRCDRAQDACKTSDPPVQGQPGGHQFACFFPIEAASSPQGPTVASAPVSNGRRVAVDVRTN